MLTQRPGTALMPADSSATHRHAPNLWAGSAGSVADLLRSTPELCKQLDHERRRVAHSIDCAGRHGGLARTRRGCASSAPRLREYRRRCRSHFVVRISPTGTKTRPEGGRHTCPSEVTINEAGRRHHRERTGQITTMQSTPGRSGKFALRSVVRTMRLVARAVAAIIRSCALRLVPLRWTCASSRP